MQTITKRFENYPAAHRQPKHKGHCRFVHGHNYHFEIHFVASHMDDNGFIVDFGEMHFVKTFLTQWFDHTLLINKDDPQLEYFRNMEREGLAQLRIVENSSAEGLAIFVIQEVTKLLKPLFGERVMCSYVRVFEDELKSATAGTNFPHERQS